MKDTFVKTSGDRRSLSSHELHILDEQVLPTARRWLEDYSPDSNMYAHAKQTLAYWGEAQ